MKKPEVSIDPATLDSMLLLTKATRIKQMGHNITLFFDSRGIRNQAVRMLQNRGYAAYPRNGKAIAIEIYVADSLVSKDFIKDEMPTRPKSPGDSLAKHLSHELEVISDPCPEGLFEIVNGRSGYVINVIAGELGTHQIKVGFDKEILKAEIKRLHDFGYYNRAGTWSEKWFCDGEVVPQDEGYEVLFSLREGKRHGEKFTVDASEYSLTVKQLITDGYRKQTIMKKGASDNDSVETWLLNDTMNIRRMSKK